MSIFSIPCFNVTPLLGHPAQERAEVQPLVQRHPGPGAGQDQRFRRPDPGGAEP